MWPTFFICSTLQGAADTAGCWRFVSKSGDTARNQSTGVPPSADPDLTMTLAADSLYQVVGVLRFEDTTNSNAPGHKLKVELSSAADQAFGMSSTTQYFGYTPTGDSRDYLSSLFIADDYLSSGSRYSQSNSSRAAGDPLSCFIVLDETYAVGATPITADIVWGLQNDVPLGITSLKSGSYLAYHKLTIEHGFAVKAADAQRFSNTAQDDPDLQFPTVAGATYFVKCRLLLKGASGVGATVGVTGNGTIAHAAGLIRAQSAMYLLSTTDVDLQQNDREGCAISTDSMQAGYALGIAGYGDGTTYVDGGSDVEIHLLFKATDAGTFAIKWGQAALSGVNPAVMAKGSSVFWQRIE